MSLVLSYLSSLQLPRVDLIVPKVGNGEWPETEGVVGKYTLVKAYTNDVILINCVTGKVLV